MYKVNLSKLKQSRIYIAILLITFIIYGNSINNEYALDDNIVVDGVEKVNDGFKAIPKIFTSHYAVDKKQSYGYRPMVSLSFAIEKQFFKGLPAFQTKEEKEKKDKLTQANVSHFINVLLYALTCMVLFNFLSLLLKEYHKLLPLLITLIFIVHPLHTEPVANIKSRDELLMLLGILLALVHYLKYGYTGKVKHVLYGGLFVLMALLSKKSTIAMIGIVPVVMYFTKINWKKILICTSSILIFGVVIILMKKGLVSETGSRNVKFFENPLLYYGGFKDRILMGFYCSWFYLKMLIFPKDLSFYYGYSQIPIAHWSHYQVWLGILIFIPVGIYGFWRFIKRDVLGLGIVLWFGVMLGVINVFFPIVGIVADRFTYAFSLGFCIVLGYLLFKLFKVDVLTDVPQINLPKGFVVSILAITIIYSGRTIARNSDWHDYLTLYTTDIEHLENSAKAHSLIANTLYPKALNKLRKNPQNPNLKKEIETVIFHYKEAIRVDSTYTTSLNNLGSAYINFYADYNNGIKYCKKALTLKHDYEEATLNIATAYSRLGAIDSAYFYFIKTIKINPENNGIYNSVNNFLIKNGLEEKGISDMEDIAKQAQNPKFVFMNMANLSSLNKTGMNQTIHYFERAFEHDQTDTKLCNHLVMLHNNYGDKQKAQYYASICN